MAHALAVNFRPSSGIRAKCSREYAKHRTQCVRGIQHAIARSLLQPCNDALHCGQRRAHRGGGRQQQQQACRKKPLSNATVA